MRRFGVLCALVLATGCSGFSDAFTARPQAAAEAAGAPLKVERLSAFLLGMKGMPVNAEAARGVAGLWVDHMLFAQALARGEDLADSSFAADALWADLVELQASRWHDTLMARRVQFSPGQADSAYAADQERILQHLLITAKATAPAPERQAARRKAEQARARIAAGASFATVAGEVSEDGGSREDGGYLPLAPKGRWVTSFDSAGWSLAPGQVTGILETPFGYHVIRRPPLDEVRDRILDALKQRYGTTLDSLYLDSLGIRKKLTVVRSAPAAIRSAVADFDGALRSTEAVAKWDGGKLTLAEFSRWLNALGPSFINDVASRPDSGLVLLAQAIGQNALLLAEANAEGISISSADWAILMERHRARVDSLREVLALGPDKLDSTASTSERANVAALAVDQYWSQVAEGKGRPFPVPGPLALALRTRGTYRYFPAGLDLAVSTAEETRNRPDSAATPPPGGAARPPAPAP